MAYEVHAAFTAGASCGSAVHAGWPSVEYAFIAVFVFAEIHTVVDEHVSEGFLVGGYLAVKDQWYLIWVVG